MTPLVWWTLLGLRRILMGLSRECNEAMLYLNMHFCRTTYHSCLLYCRVWLGVAVVMFYHSAIVHDSSYGAVVANLLVNFGA